MKNQPEQKLTNDWIADQLKNKGWKFVDCEKLQREGSDEPILKQNLRKSLEEINPNLKLTENEITEVLNELRLAPTTVNGNKKVLEYLKYGINVKFDEDKVVKNIKLIDYENPKNNEFIVSREVHFSGNERIRADIILFVNGIPLANIEGKNPASPHATWENARNQIKRYERQVPDLYKYAQIGVAVGALGKYFPIIPWQENPPVYEWKEKDKSNNEALVEFLKAERVIDFIRNYTFIREEHGEATKVMARYMQYRAANKIFNRVIGNMRGEEERNKGLIWHWQGSGKTFTMIFAAHKLRWDKTLENPTIFFIIDRVDLEEQLMRETAALDLNFGVDKVGSINELQELIKADNYKGRRGAFITLIHKFDPNNDDWIPEDIEKEVKSGDRKKTIAERKNVIAFLDEVHRTQYGTLSAQMKSILNNAFFFGFTGTPIAEDDRDTYREFGYPIDDEEYLDRYFIDQSQEDGFTVPIVFEPRVDKVEFAKDELQVVLDEFLSNDEIEELDEDTLRELVSDKLGSRELFLENKDRIEKIAEDMVGHFKEQVEDRFKAMVVAGSRRACVLYKKAFDKYLEEDETEVVMSFQAQEKDNVIRDFKEEWQNRQSGKDFKASRDKIIKSYKEKETPKILIVTDMLLTGFDAPALQTMYIDKPMKKHNLLQAIARVNRPYKDVKEAGVVVDYVGVLKNTKRAIENYYDLDDVSHAVMDYEMLGEVMTGLINSMKDIFGDAPKEVDRDDLSEAVDKLRSEGNLEQEFLNSYREARKVFELLGSHESKLDFLDEYRWFTAIYSYYMKLKGSDSSEKSQTEKYFRKTVDVIQKEVSVDRIEKDLPAFKLDNEYLNDLEESKANKKEKVMNIVFGLERKVLVQDRRDPVLESVSEKVQALIRKWREKSIDYEEVYDEGVEIIDEIEEKRSEKDKLGLSDVEHGIFMTLEDFLVDLSEDKISKLSKSLYENIDDYMLEGWIDNSVLRQKLRRGVKEFSRKMKVNHELNLSEMNKLYKSLLEKIENYG